MKSPENFTPPQTEVSKTESEMTLSPEVEVVEATTESLEQYKETVEAHIDEQSTNINAEAGQKIESSAKNMNVSPELLDSTKAESGLENQMAEIQDEANQLNRVVKLEISETVAEAPVENTPESEVNLSGGNESKEDKLETGGKVFEFLDRTKFLDVRKSDEQFNEWLQKLSYEDYTDYVTRLNGILREVPIKDRGVDGGEGEEVSIGTRGYNFYVPPGAEQKDGLMRESFQALKQIPDNEDRALLAYYTMQAVHPYADGNGRTGRLLHEIISEDGKEITSEKLSELLDHEEKGPNAVGKGQDIFSERVLEPSSAYEYINREVAKEVLGDDFFKQYGSIHVERGVGKDAAFLPTAVKEKLSPEDVILAEKILGEAGIKNFSTSGIVLARLLLEKSDEIYNQYHYEYPLNEEADMSMEGMEKKYFGIDGQNLMANLSEEDAHRLIEIHASVKNRFIEDMIDIFVHPENRQMKDENGKDIPIKSVFRRS